ncbi:MAG: hypothetical protein ACREOQ_06060 [Gemmatimonadales bacterium]
MLPLHVALQEGFSDDEVVVKVNGVQVRTLAGVTTKNQIGYAGALDLELPAGETNLEVAIPTRGVAETTLVRLDEPVFLGVSVTSDGQLHFQQSHEPFRYV